MAALVIWARKGVNVYIRSTEHGCVTESLGDRHKEQAVSRTATAEKTSEVSSGTAFEWTLSIFLLSLTP